MPGPPWHNTTRGTAERRRQGLGQGGHLRLPADQFTRHPTYGRGGPVRPRGPPRAAPDVRRKSPRQVSISAVLDCLSGDRPEKEEPMKYMMLIYQGTTPTPPSPEWDNLPEEAKQEV